jgi:hypothetical protein
MDFLLQPLRSHLQAIKQRLRRWTKPENHTRALDVALDLTCSKSELMIENALPTSTQIAPGLRLPTDQADSTC